MTNNNNTTTNNTTIAIQTKSRNNTMDDNVVIIPSRIINHYLRSFVLSLCFSVTVLILLFISTDTVVLATSTVTSTNRVIQTAAKTAAFALSKNTFRQVDSTSTTTTRKVSKVTTTSILHSNTNTNTLSTSSKLNNNKNNNRLSFMSTTSFSLSLSSSNNNNNNNNDSSTTASSAAQVEAQRLLDRARQVRQQLAELQGITIEQVELEAKTKKQQQQQIQQEQINNAQLLKLQKEQQKQLHDNNTNNQHIIMEVPISLDDQLIQAKYAIERAVANNITRHIVRFALMECNEESIIGSTSSNQNQNTKVTSDQTLYDTIDLSWPGGVQQIYRRAVGPMTRELLRIVRLPIKKKTTDTTTSTSTSTSIDFQKQPKIISQDIWDFDGSALITAQSSIGSLYDIQALVLANTDSKYTKDIESISETVTNDRLFILINPFWKDLVSWGYNILQPNSKQYAQKIIFGGGTTVTDSTNFQEIYSIQIRSVRGEDCIAIKSYPYDWSLYVYYEGDDNYYNSQPYPIYLGSTQYEPTVADFGKLIEKRTEFLLNKTMRRLQRQSQK